MGYSNLLNQQTSSKSRPCQVSSISHFLRYRGNSQTCASLPTSTMGCRRCSPIPFSRNSHQQSLWRRMTMVWRGSGSIRVHSDCLFFASFFPEHIQNCLGLFIYLLTKWAEDGRGLTCTWAKQATKIEKCKLRDVSVSIVRKKILPEAQPLSPM